MTIAVEDHEEEGHDEVHALTVANKGEADADGLEDLLKSWLACVAFLEVLGVWEGPV